MDSTRDYRHSLYNSIPGDFSAHAPRGNRVQDLVAHFNRSPSFSRLLSATSVIILVLASLFVLSSPCISCDIFTFKHRLTNLGTQPKFVAPLYAPVSVPSVEYNQAFGSFLPTARSYSRNSLNRYLHHLLPNHAHQQIQDADDIVLVQKVEANYCTTGLECFATLVVTKEGDKVTIEAGYIIKSLTSAPQKVTDSTRKRMSRVARIQSLVWAVQLLRTIGLDLMEVGCSATQLMIADAIWRSFRAAAHCPSTDDPSCHTLITVEECYLPGTEPKDSCEEAFEKCEFTFYGEYGLAAFGIGGSPDRSFTPRIVAKDPDVHLGVLNSNNIVPEFIDEDGVYPITDFGSQPFAPTQFKPYYIQGAGGSGIGHQTFHADQEELAKGRCVRIFFTEIQLLHPTSNLNHVPKSENKCVVFRTV